MAPKLMSTRLPRHARKWQPVNHGLESRNDEVGIIKQTRGECMKELPILISELVYEICNI